MLLHRATLPTVARSRHSIIQLGARGEGAASDAIYCCCDRGRQRKIASFLVAANHGDDPALHDDVAMSPVLAAVFHSSAT
jgi:hypothetical protein